MADVIDLISSSPTPSPPRKKTSTTLLKNSGGADRNTTIVDIDSQSTGDFPLPKSTKRRRLSLDYSSDDFPLSVSKPAPKSLAGTVGNGSLSPLLPSSKLRSKFAGASADIFDLSDDIEFTSSAPELRDRKSTEVEVLDLSSELDLPDIAHLVTGASGHKNLVGRNGALSEKTSNLLAGLQHKPSDRQRATKSTTILTNNVMQSRAMSVDEEGGSTIVAAPVKSKRPQLPKPSRSADAANEARHVDKAAAKAAKESEKQAEKERKRLEKERRAQEKHRAADLAEVNKARNDKKESTKEMMLEMSNSIRNTLLGNRIEAFMQAMEVEVHYFDDEINLSSFGMNSHAPPGNIIKWRRKVDREYDEEHDHYVSIPAPRIEDEKTILLHLTAGEFACIAGRHGGAVAHISEAAMKANLDNHISAIQHIHTVRRLLYLVEGNGSLLKKNKNAKNREYQAAAKAVNGRPEVSTENGSPPTQPTRKRKSKADSKLDLSFFTQELSDTLFLHLQLNHPQTLIHHSNNANESAHWIKVFTESLSLRPVKLQQYRFNDIHAGFCMESGQVRTGDDREDVTVRMLQELPRVTASMAWGINEAGYPGVRELVAGFRNVEGREGKAEARLMLEDVRKAVNRDGGVSERRLGPVVSRRIYRLFFGTNPDVTDV